MKTNDYSLFSYMEQNRKINEHLVSRLIESIKFIGYIESRPILTNEKYVIIDGQHRFEACKRLKLPIVFETTNIAELSAMTMLNMTQQVWQIGEYIESYAKQGKPCYIALKAFQDKYNFGWSSSIDIITKCKHNMTKVIKKGEDFKINKDSEKIASFLFQISEYVSFYKKQAFVRAVVTLFTSASPENIKKIINKAPILREQISTGDYLILFENIINKHIRYDKDKVKLRVI